MLKLKKKNKKSLSPTFSGPWTPTLLVINQTCLIIGNFTWSIAPIRNKRRSDRSSSWCRTPPWLCWNKFLRSLHVTANGVCHPPLELEIQHSQLGMSTDFYKRNLRIRHEQVLLCTDMSSLKLSKFPISLYWTTEGQTILSVHGTNTFKRRHHTISDIPREPKAMSRVH